MRTDAEIRKVMVKIATLEWNWDDPEATRKAYKKVFRILSGMDD